MIQITNKNDNLLNSSNDLDATNDMNNSKTMTIFERNT